MRILVLQLKRIGDVVLTAPALARLRTAIPDASIELVLHGVCGGLAPLIPGMDAVHVWQPGGPNWRILRHLARSRYDAVLDVTSTDRSFFLAALAGGPKRVAWSRARNARWWRRRAASCGVEASVRELTTVDFHHALADGLIRELGFEPPAEDAVVPPFLKLGAARLPAGLPTRYGVIHPGSARTEKEWPAESWAQVARELAGRGGLPVVFTGGGGEAERTYVRRIGELAGGGFLDLAGQLDLAESAAVIGGADLVLSVDSAAMHLAAQFPRPQVALFGPTNPFHWAPRHPLARVILASAPQAPVLTHVPKHIPGAMENIPVRTVAEAAFELLCIA